MAFIIPLLALQVSPGMIHQTDAHSQSAFLKRMRRLPPNLEEDQAAFKDATQVHSAKH